MLENKEYFDLSNFPENSKYHTDNNKKVSGKMKDEYGGTPISEYAGAKPKSYTLIDINNCEKSTHKGHSSNFKSSEFKDIINNKKVIRHPMKKITSKIIKYILKKVIKYLYLVLMIKDILKMME